MNENYLETLEAIDRHPAITELDLWNNFCLESFFQENLKSLEMDGYIKKEISDPPISQWPKQNIRWTITNEGKEELKRLQEKRIHHSQLAKRAVYLLSSILIVVGFITMIVGANLSWRVEQKVGDYKWIISSLGGYEKIYGFMD